MHPPLQLQLGAELTNIFPLGRIVDATFNGIVNLARNLRKSGSDFLVEEELADIFGRGRINKDVEDKFKIAVLKDSNVVGIRRGHETGNRIVLDSRPGPTLERAITRDPTKAYLATIIQLSLLTWLHGRASLAACMVECMEIRYLSGAPGATENSGVDAIQSALDTCSSQTGGFMWSDYVHRIEQRVAQSFPNFRHEAAFTTLTPKLLLACMDYLFILQRLPEDRRLVIDSQMGFVTLIIWAHYCLDLNVILSGVPGGDITFGASSEKPTQLVIKWTPSVVQPEVCLFDGKMRVVLIPGEPERSRITACERLPLEDFGTTLMWRWLNTETATAKNSTLYSEAIQYVLALAIATLPNLVRFSWDPVTTPEARLQINRWQIYDVAKVIFASASYNEAEIEAYVQAIAGRAPLLTIEPPPALLHYWKKISRPPGRPLPVQLYMLRLVVLIIALASVAGIKDCGQLPLVSDISWLEVVGFTSKIMNHPGPHLVQSTDLYYSVVQVMMGGIDRFLVEERATNESSFMISEYGWTVFLSSVGVEDPSLAIPGQLFLQKGVPTKESTGERRFRVRDSDSDDMGSTSSTMMPCREMLDRGKTYVPRCVERVVKRVEYYGITKDDFRLNIRHCVELCTTSKSVVDATFDIHRSFRAFHEGLWESLLAPPCSHNLEELSQEPVKLPLGVAAGTALDWDEGDAGDAEEPERICIALTKDDPNTRWLAIAMGGRKVMIRGKSTCVSCAVDSAASLPGKWLVVI